MSNLYDIIDTIYTLKKEYTNRIEVHYEIYSEFLKILDTQTYRYWSHDECMTFFGIPFYVQYRWHTQYWPNEAKVKLIDSKGHVRFLHYDTN